MRSTCWTCCSSSKPDPGLPLLTGVAIVSVIAPAGLRSGVIIGVAHLPTDPAPLGAAVSAGRRRTATTFRMSPRWPLWRLPWPRPGEEPLSRCNHFVIVQQLGGFRRLHDAIPNRLGIAGQGFGRGLYVLILDAQRVV